MTIPIAIKYNFVRSFPKGQWVYINPAHKSLFGRSSEEAHRLDHREWRPLELAERLDPEVAPGLLVLQTENWTLRSD